MTESDSDLRATADDLIADAERLEEIEREKGALDPSDPRVVTLSQEAEEIARRMVPKTIAQRELAKHASGDE